MNDAVATVTHDFGNEMLRWKRMFQVFQTFQRYVAIILYGCCKSRSVMLHILQVFQRHVASVSEVLFKMFHLFQTYVASVLIWMLHMFHTYVARICSKCFSCFSVMLQCMFSWWQVASVLSDVAYVSHICCKCMF